MIQISAHLIVQEGKIEEFKAAAARCRSLVEAHERGNGNTQYDWFLSEGEELCEVRETYTDSAAVQAHLENVGDALGELLMYSDLTGLNIYGEPSEELLMSLTNLPVEVYAPL